ncbi:MAG: M23 family metallopeptidase [Candidatus Omnitrophica bacterium]|nr:M23 family metallopeptidase [Candidatus Omnitrophota bacterium]
MGGNRLRGRRAFGFGVLVGLLLTAAAVEAPYVNWRSVAPPIDADQLLVRQDAKGDGRFGAPRSGRRSHRGIDLVAPLDSPVRAIRSGTVTRVGTHRGLGRFVELSHRRDLTSLYAHLATTTVTQGQRVTQGQAIGTVGKTGNARHPWISAHLHLEVTRRGEVIDPATVGLRVLASTAATEQEAHGRGGD